MDILVLNKPGKLRLDPAMTKELQSG